MGYNELEIELHKILAQIARWRETGYMPTIEQGIALSRMQKIYTSLLDLPCGDLEPEEISGKESPIFETIADSHSTHWTSAHDEEISARTMTIDDQIRHTDAAYGDLDAPDDESFEPCCNPDVDTPGSEQTLKADDDGNFADLPAEEVHRKSGETFLKQEYGAKDLCPPPVEFPEGNDTDKNTITDTDESETDPDTDETNTAEGGPSEETHLMQEFGAHDVCPPQTEVPEIDQIPEVKPEAPRIFGIDVTPYARHEIIDTLFHGNVDLFEIECTKLNNMDSLEEALVYIGETYHWIPENAATIKFIDLLETRFGA